MLHISRKHPIYNSRIRIPSNPTIYHGWLWSQDAAFPRSDLPVAGRCHGCRGTLSTPHTHEVSAAGTKKLASSCDTPVPLLPSFCGGRQSVKPFEIVAKTELEWEMRAALTDFVLSLTLSPPLSLKLYKILISTCCNKKIMIKSKSLMDEYENRILSQLLVLFFFTPIVFYVRVSDYRQIVWVFEGSDYRMVQTHTGHHRHAVSIMPICLIQSAWTYTDVLQLVRGILCTGPLC